MSSSIKTAVEWLNTFIELSLFPSFFFCRFDFLLILRFLNVISENFLEANQIAMFKDRNIFWQGFAIDPFILNGFSEPLIAALCFYWSLIIDRLLVLDAARKKKVHAMYFISFVPENLVHVKFDGF